MASRISTAVESLTEEIRSRIINSATSPFGHARYPLENTLDFANDPGLLGPGSVSWSVLGDVAAFVGGIRALLIQAAHPEVVAGVGDHSRYRDDPLGRLSRTSAYVTATTYGAMPEVHAAVDQVKHIHTYVSGVSSRGVPYDASDPGFSAWVHNVLTDSFLVAHLTYGGIPLTSSEADQFVAEQTRVGALLGANPMPETRADLSAWITNHPEIGPSPEMRDAIDFLVDPPLEPTLRVGYALLRDAAIATIPDRVRMILDLDDKARGRPVGHVTTKGLRWALGYSPSWRLALRRCGAEEPENLFTQEPRVA